MENFKIKKEPKLITFFRSEYFVLITFVSIVIPLMMHTANLLLQVSSIKNPWYAYFFAFSFDLAIFAFAINGRNRQATGLAFIVFALNVCFFNLEALYSIFGAEELATKLLVRLFVTVIISGSGSWIIHSYVAFFNEKIGERNYMIILLEKCNSNEAVINKLRGDLKEKEEVIRSKDNEVTLLKNEIENKRGKNGGDSSIMKIETELKFPYTCQGCGHMVREKKTFDMLTKHCKKVNCVFKVNDDKHSEGKQVVLEELKTAN